MGPRDEIERLREYVERRAQTQENLVRAMLAENVARAVEALEGRIQLATQEAIAFAEQGLSSHDAALAALGRRLAELSRPPEPPPAEAAPVEAREFLIGVASPRWASCAYLPLKEDDLAALPILPGGAALLVLNQVVEQLAPEALAPLWSYWRARLAAGGELIVVTPDGPALAKDFAALQMRLAEVRPLRQLFDADRLGGILLSAGFAPGSCERSGLMLEIRARRAP